MLFPAADNNEYVRMALTYQRLLKFVYFIYFLIFLKILVRL